MITVKNSKPRPAYHPDTNLRYGAGLPGGGAKFSTSSSWDIGQITTAAL